jgi:hypothetical protein
MQRCRSAYYAPRAMNSISVKPWVRAVTVFVLAAAALCYVAFACGRAWHQQSSSDVVILFLDALFLCAVPLWLLVHFRSIRQDAATIVSGIAAGAVVLSCHFAPQNHPPFCTSKSPTPGRADFHSIFGFWFKRRVTGGRVFGSVSGAVRRIGLCGSAT